MKLVRFKGVEYLFGGESLDQDGFVATREQYESGEASFAHWFLDRGLMQHGKKIGSREDLELIGEAEAQCGGNYPLGAIVNILTHPSWNAPLTD
jgi:hypothetical protein